MVVIDMIVVDERAPSNRPLVAVVSRRLYRGLEGLAQERSRSTLRQVHFDLKGSLIYLMRRVNCFGRRCGVFLFLIWNCQRGNNISLADIYWADPRILPDDGITPSQVPLHEVISRGLFFIFAVRTSAPSLEKATAICSHRMVRQPQIHLPALLRRRSPRASPMVDRLKSDVFQPQKPPTVMCLITGKVLVYGWGERNVKPWNKFPSDF